jgi:hypothetical protein
LYDRALDYYVTVELPRYYKLIAEIKTFIFPETVPLGEAESNKAAGT